MANKNENKMMQNWVLQQKQESQEDLRKQNEHMNDKYQQMKNDYISFSNTSAPKEEIYKINSELQNKNTYMSYELNNTFNHKDSGKKEK